MNLLCSINNDFVNILQKTEQTDQILNFIEQIKIKTAQVGDDDFTILIKPYFIDSLYYKIIEEATQQLANAIEKICVAFLSGYNFNELLHQEEIINRLTRIDPLYPNCQVIIRLDALFHPDLNEIKFLEVNCGDPNGIGWNDVLLDRYMQLPVIHELSKRYKLHADYLLLTQFEAVMRKYQQFCNRKNITPKPQPNCAILCNNDSTARGDLRIIADYYTLRGCWCELADPRDLNYDGQRLTIDDQEIDVLYRDSIGDFILYPKAKAALCAYRDGNVCFVNPVRSAIGDFKNIFAIMSDEQYHHLFSAKEIKAIQHYIPWTRPVREGKTYFYGEEIDLLSLLRNQKDHFVIKPNRGYKGTNIMIGRETEQTEWEKMLDKSLTADYTAQEFVAIPTDNFPIIGSDYNLSIEQRYIKIECWSHDGKFAGISALASTNKIINISKGASQIVVFSVGE